VKASGGWWSSTFTPSTILHHLDNLHIRSLSHLHNLWTGAAMPAWDVIYHPHSMHTEVS